MAASFRIVFLGFIASFFALGMYDMLANYEPNGCEMTYMYQLPEYMEVPLSPKIEGRFPRYGLYLYGEGQYATRSKNLALSGIPVLFIPGNAGSHKQVRSLASVSLKMAESRQTEFHFNYFSLDLNEELSGLFGGVLHSQTEFTFECIKHIRTLYNTAPSKPKSVVVVGHSMGGMVARALFSLPGFDPTFVTVILTQATPHQAPVINLDSEMNQFYSDVNRYWQENVNTSLQYVTVHSTGGGYRDLLVRYGLTHVRNLVAPDKELSSLTMSVPRAWVSTDHLCHVWCKQIVLATVRAMFDMVDKSSKQIAQGPKYRMKVWRHHFERNPGPKLYKPAYAESITLDSAIKWEVRKKMAWKFGRDKVLTTRYSVVPLLRDSEHAFVIITNMKSDAWIGACAVKPKQNTCSELVNLAPYAKLLPPLYSEKKVLHVPAEMLLERSFSHLVVVLPKSRSRVEVNAELYNVTSRNIVYNLPSLFSMIGSTGTHLGAAVVINRTAPDAIYYNISIADFGAVLDTYTAHLIAKECKNVDQGNYAGSVMRLHIPWSNEDTYSFIRAGKSGNISLKVQTAKPANFPYNAELHLYLNPACSYHVVVTRSWIEMFGQFVRYYWSLLPAFAVIQVFMSLSWQLKQLDEEGLAVSFAAAHARWAQPWRVVPLGLLLRFMLTYPEEASIANKIGLPVDDTATLTEMGIWLPALPIFLYLTAYAVVELYSYILQFNVQVMSQLCKVIFKSCCLSVRVVQGFVVIEYLTLMAAVVVAATMCGTLGMVLVLVVYKFKVISNSIWAKESEDKFGAWGWNRYHVNFTLLILIILTIALNGPTLIYWVKSLKYGVMLDVDPSRWTGIILAVSALMLTYADLPVPATELYGLSSGILFISSVIMVHYTTVSVYRISYFISTNLLILSLPILLLVLVAKLTGTRGEAKEAGGDSASIGGSENPQGEDKKSK